MLDPDVQTKKKTTIGARLGEFQTKPAKSVKGIFRILPGGILFIHCLIDKKSLRHRAVKYSLLLLPQCPLCLLEMILSSTTPTPVLSKRSNTLLLFLSTVSHFTPVCNYCNTHLSRSECHIHDRQVYSSESYLSLAPIHYVLSVLAAANTKDPLPTPRMS
jgi:hypothetical protein